jgi:methylated-DNA-[protein]-cysteine S-methyltransferase
MADVYAMVLPTTSIGKVRFRFDEEGALTEVKMNVSDPVGLSGKRPAKAPTKAAVGAWLKSYLKAEDHPFPGSWRNPGSTAFSESVYRVVAEVPAGQTLSYGEVAAKAGSPKASRAVGGAMGRNPIPLVVP